MSLVFVNKEIIDRVSEKLGMSAKAVARATYRAINGVAAKAFTRSRREIRDQVNLSATYIRERMWLQKANSSRQVAVIAARKRPTRLATYGARQRTRKDKGTKRPAGRNGGKLFGVQAGAGDTLRNINQGMVPAGVSVSVKRGGQRQLMPGAFFMPLRAGKVAAVNGMGVFIRTGSGKKDIKHLYGPSVDQLFRGVIDDISPDVQAELEAELLRQANYEFSKVTK